jgi:hypothetical protein
VAGVDPHEWRHPTIAPEPATGRRDPVRALAVVLSTFATTLTPTHPHGAYRRRAYRPRPSDTGSGSLDPTRVLVADRERRTPRQRALLEVVHEVEIRVARTCPADPDEHLSRRRLGICDVAKLSGLTEPDQLERAHSSTSQVSAIRRFQR